MMTRLTKLEATIKRLTSVCDTLDILRELGTAKVHEIKLYHPDPRLVKCSLKYLEARKIVQMSKPICEGGGWIACIYSVDVNKVYALSASICEELDELEALHEASQKERVTS